MDAVTARLRTLRSFLPQTATREETVLFAKYGNKDDFEMADVPNGTTTLSTPGECGDGDDMQNGSVLGVESMGPSHPRNAISEWQAGWNVTNAIQGMFIVSLPYAVLHGGYWGIFAMVGVSYICCHTGKILVDCLYEEDQYGVKHRVRDSYVAIAEVAWGKRVGSRIVNIAQIIELLMTCILYVVLCGDLMIGSFPDSSIGIASWMTIACTLLLPCAFLKHLGAVSWLSFWCSMVHLVINIIILGYCFSRAGEWDWSSVKVSIDIWTFPIALGIVVFSYTSQIFLPTLEGNMTRPDRFTCMLNVSHVAAAIFKAGFGWLGFLTFGFATQEVITNNLPTPSFKAVVNMILVVKALLSYPLPFYAAAELLETALFNEKAGTCFPSCYRDDGAYKIWAISLRILLVVFTLVMAVSVPHFAILMGLIGSFTGTMLSFVWPCYFHMRLKWNTLGWLTVMFDAFIIFLGFCCGTIGIYYSGYALIVALKYY